MNDKSKVRRQQKPIVVNLRYEDAEAAAFERLKRATGIANNADVVRHAVQQSMVHYNIRVVANAEEL
jgi:hypothetical protein